MNDEEIKKGDLVKCLGRTTGSAIHGKIGIVLDLEVDKRNSDCIVALLLIEGEVKRKSILRLEKLRHEDMQR